MRPTALRRAMQFLLQFLWVGSGLPAGERPIEREVLIAALAASQIVFGICMTASALFMHFEDRVSVGVAVLGMFGGVALSYLCREALSSTAFSWHDSPSGWLMSSRATRLARTVYNVLLWSSWFLAWGIMGGKFLRLLLTSN